MLAGSGCEGLGDVGEIIQQQRNPSNTDLIETKQPLWAAQIAWLKLSPGHFCLLKKIMLISNKHPARLIKSLEFKSGNSRVRQPWKQMP